MKIGDIKGEAGDSGAAPSNGADQIKNPEEPQAGITGYLKIDDIPGESQAQSGGGAGKATFKEFSVVKKSDSATAATGDANLDGEVDAEDLNSAAAADSDHKDWIVIESMSSPLREGAKPGATENVQAPKSGPQKTSFGVLLDGGSGGDATGEDTEPQENAGDAEITLKDK